MLWKYFKKCLQNCLLIKLLHTQSSSLEFVWWLNRIIRQVNIINTAIVKRNDTRNNLVALYFWDWWYFSVSHIEIIVHHSCTTLIRKKPTVTLFLLSDSELRYFILKKTTKRSIICHLFGKDSIFTISVANSRIRQI